MGLFGQSSPFDADIEKATSEKNTTEQWGVIMDICDKVGSNPRNAKDCLKAIMRRMGHNDPHVVIQAITLLDACVNNCGKNYHLEVASREFENEFVRLLIKAQPQIASKMRLLLKSWAENDFKNDPQLNLIPTLYQRLKSEGQDFSDSQKAPKVSIPATVIKDPNVVTSQQEEDDIAKAIELSLKESKGSPKKQQQSTATNNSPYSSLYPSFTGSPQSTGGGASGGGAVATAATSLNAPTTYSEPRKVRALYDFEAAEENELTFVAGEIIHVLDDSDSNWWKGYNQKGEGLFPSNFVTADLSVEPERIDINLKTKKTVQFDDEASQGEKTDSKLDDDEKDYVPEINEEKIDRLLHLLHEANPEDPSQDTDEMIRLEEQVNKMGPLIDAELERVDRKHAQLTQLSSDLVDAINLYHTLMREPDRTAGMPAGGSGLGGPMNYAPGFSAQHNMYGPNPMYHMPMNLYHPTSTAPSSMPDMSMIHMMSASTQQQPQSIHPQQMPMLNTASGPGSNFQQQPQQMIPIQYQNGHQQQNPQQLPPQQPPQHQMQHLQNTVPSNPQSAGGPPQSQLMHHPQQHQHPQQQHNPNQNFHPPPNTMPGYPPQPNSFVPPVNFNIQDQQHSAMIHNNPMLGMMGAPSSQQPQSMQINQQQPQMHQMLHQLSAINQPVTHTILGQNDSKTNIPVYQQQR